MRKTSLILSIIFLVASAAVYSQTTFNPRSGAEVQAWRFYKQFKESKANEARLKAAIRQGKGDFSDISGSSIGGLAGIITGDATDLANLRKELAIELALQDSLLMIWEKTFFWRYGDLKDIDRPPVRDAKSGRSMDPIEFAITYSPFYRDVVTKAAGTTFTAEKGSADAWSHLRVTMANVTEFKSSDSPGWRNNGTRFTAKADGRVPIRVEIIGKAGVSYNDYEFSVSVKTQAGSSLLDERGKISKEGGIKSFTTEWDPAAKPGSLSIAVNIGGGNPESFIYYVSGTIDTRP